MSRSVDKLFTPEDRERIAAAVRQAEQHTSGEIVPYIVGQCDEYEEAVWRGGAFGMTARSRTSSFTRSPRALTRGWPSPPAGPCG